MSELGLQANGSNSIAYFDTNGVGRPFPAGYEQWISNMRRGYYSAIAYVDVFWTRA